MTRNSRSQVAFLQRIRRDDIRLYKRNYWVTYYYFYRRRFRPYTSIQKPSLLAFYRRKNNIQRAFNCFFFGRALPVVHDLDVLFAARRVERDCYALRAGGRAAGAAMLDTLLRRQLRP